MNVKRLGAVVSAVLLSAGFAGCGGESSTGPGDDWQPASFDAALSVASDLPPGTLKSVKIEGYRNVPAAPWYNCSNTTTLCLNVDEDGNFTNPDGGPTHMERLCPSTDYPSDGYKDGKKEGDWIFTYELYAEEGCDDNPDNVVLNNEYNDYNLRCFDSDNLGNPSKWNNTTVETLYPGDNHNTVLCATRNANKDWEFTVCEDLSPEAAVMDAVCVDGDPNVVLNCGCYPDNEYSVASRGGHGHHPTKDDIRRWVCGIFGWKLPFCHDYEEPEYPTDPEPEPDVECACDFDKTKLPDNCEFDSEHGCLIKCYPESGHYPHNR